MNVHALKETRAAKIAEIRALHDKVADADRDLDEGERKRFDALETEIRGLSDKIDRAEKIDAFDRLEARGETVAGGDMQRELRNYSLAKAAHETLAGRLSGLEAEIHAELSKGREARGLMVPVDVLLGTEQRAVTTTTPVSGAGGNLVRTDLAAMTDRRRPALMVERMGAMVLRGLTGDLDLPRLSASGAASWVAEHNAVGGSDPAFEKKNMTPKTVGAQYELSRRMILQANEAIEQVLRRDLGMILAQALDAAAIQGGGSNQPTGIIEDSDVTEYIESGSISLSSDLTATLIGQLETNDVTGTRAFLTHPELITTARKIKETGTGRVIPISETFHGERVEASTQVPSDLGGSGGTDKALIYGEWASLYLGYWSGVDILLNPYHADVASKGGVLLHAFLDADVVVRHPEGFTFAAVA